MSIFKHKTKLVTGDSSGDGHEKSDDFYIESNLTKAEINAAYERGSEIIGFDFCKEIASEYENREFPLDKVKILEELGMFEYCCVDVMTDKKDNITGAYLYPESFLQVFLFIVKLGNSSFEYEQVKAESYIDIGGYGLYY